MFALLGTSVTQKIHERVVEVACESSVAQGRKLKTDTTCVESIIHYPTDSSLLGDGIRVLNRSLARVAAECKSGAVKVVHHVRSVKYCLLVSTIIRNRHFLNLCRDTAFKLRTPLGEG